MADGFSPDSFHYRIRREASGAVAFVRRNWTDRRFLRWIVYALVGFILLWLALWFFLARDLPDAESLVDYETPLPSVVRGGDGEIVHSYARERRVQLQFNDYPKQLVQAYLSAEDKTFFSHGGVDLTGTANAVFDYVTKFGSGERAVGGSTITQQVAKNLLLGDEYSVTRKLKEMMLARRIEAVLSKEEILTLYLNEIPLGRRSFGVQAAARAYFDKDVGELDLNEIAFLAILPKAPERYGRAANEEAALDRRNFVLSQMVANDFVSASDAQAARGTALGLVTQRSQRSADAGYFIEEVRRQLMERFGETAEDGDNSVYAGGLWVRTSLDMEMQNAARDALRKGLLRYHGRRGWSGPIATLDPDKGSLTGQLASSTISISYDDWRVGVVTERSGSRGTIGFSDGETGPLIGIPGAVKAGDVIAVKASGNGWAVRALPEAEGALVVQDAQLGRITAMQGGFDSRLGSFNRATQAQRQPGSTIKPFVYATGLDHGMTPASAIDNGRYCYYQGSRYGEKCFRGGRGGQFPLRYGLEQSQNVMTVQVAMTAGMPNVVKQIEDLGIGSYDPYPAFALGAGETTVMKMVAAYGALANHGRMNPPSVIDYVQDRRGKVIWSSDTRDCERCNMADWDGQPMPRLGLKGKQVMDARTAFQTMHMLRGVVQRGTATTLNSIDLPLFGKTGTTTGPKDVWFIGGTQRMIAGAYVGFDRPRNMGGYAQGGTIAAPIIKDLIRNSRDLWSDSPAVAPSGVRMVRINRRTGKRVLDGLPGSGDKSAVIWEAFKPDTEPPRATAADEIASRRAEILDLIRKARSGGTTASPAGRSSTPSETEAPPSDFVEDQGGIY